MAVAADGLAEGRPISGLRASSSPLSLVLLAGLPVLAGAWALFSPKIILSREMAWDFLYILSGAWQMQHGHVAHVDFHEPLGDLNFSLTWLGFQIVGPTLSAFMISVAIMLAAVFASAVLATMRRLPTVPAALFVMFVSLLVLMPANIGDKPEAYSFAMTYNRYGWSLLSILALIAFMPPRNRSGGDWGDWIDIVNGAFLLTVLYYIKVTYFAAGLALLGLAVLFFPHMRARFWGWAIAGGLVVANAVAPWNHPYLIDIVQIARAGSVRSSLDFHLSNFLTNGESYVPYAAILMIALWMWLRGSAPLRLVLAVAALLGVGIFVISQNHQTHGLPLGIVAAFLLYDQVRDRFGPAVPALAVLMIFPAFSIVTSLFSLATYHVRTGRVEHLRIVDTTQIKGLAVRVERPDTLATFSKGPYDYTLFNRARSAESRFELTVTEYVETLVEAAALLGDGRHRPGGIVVLDQVNPLSFMLGWKPPRGGNLWEGLVMPKVPAEETFSEADYVLIPKFSTYSPWTNWARFEYGDYLSRNFPTREETQSWIVLSRGTSNPQHAESRSSESR